MSTMHTPPPNAPMPPGPPERRCPRCGSTLAPDQEWCLSCGAAADTEVVEARGWRVPLYLGGGLVALAVLGVILAIVALASQKQEVAQTPTPTPTPSIVGGVAPLPTTSPEPLPTTTPDPNATATPFPTATTSPEPTPTEDPGFDDGTDGGTGTTSSFPGWTIGDGWTVIIESATTQSKAEEVAQQAEDDGETVGILNSDDYSSLNGGYYVVFSGEYTSESEAEDALPGLKSSYHDAYVRQIKQ